jgi:hypothetical protein
VTTPISEQFPEPILECNLQRIILVAMSEYFRHADKHDLPVSENCLLCDVFAKIMLIRLRVFIPK